MSSWRIVERPVLGVAVSCLIFTGLPSGMSGQAVPGEVQNAVRILDEEAHYVLPDSTLSDVIARLNRTRLAGAGEMMAQGLTEYRIQPAWRPTGAGGRCRVSDLILNVHVRVTLPSWPGMDARPAEEQASWRLIEDAIRSHEYQHRDLTVDAAELLADALVHLRTRGCRALERAFAGEMALADQRLREAHDQLDRDTPDRLAVGRRPAGPP